MTLRVTVLGCSGSFPGPGVASSGYLVQSDAATVWLDAGAGTFSVLQEHIDPATVDAIVLSHSHVDHWIDLTAAHVAYRYFLDRRGLPVYGTAETRDMAIVLVGRHAGETFRWTTIDESSRFSVGDLAFSFARTAHPVETLAVRVDCAGRSLAYSADTGSRWSLRALGDGIDLALVEASLPAEREDAFEHLSGRQAGVLAAEAGVARLVVTHIVPGVDPEAQRRDAAAAFGGPVELAAPHARFDV